MSNLTTFALNALAADFVALAVEVSLHTALPNSSGSNETTAARQTPAWTNTSGTLTLSATEAFTGGAASGPVQYVGLWDTGGTHFLGSFQITSGDTTFNASGAYTLDNITIPFA